MSGALSRGFPASAGRHAALLILGSLPGRRSLAATEYYAHPRNAFWTIAERLFGVPADAAYDVRLDALHARGIALWDVLASSHRPGSLDADIDLASAQVNDIAGFAADHPELRLVALNGRTAGKLYERRILPDLREPPAHVVLPSTSPAHAAMSVGEKCRRWSVVTAALTGKQQ